MNGLRGGIEWLPVQRIMEGTLNPDRATEMRSFGFGNTAQKTLVIILFLV
jgi:hypothetical protein